MPENMTLGGKNMFGKMMNSFYYGKSGKGDFKQEDLPKNRWQLFWEMLRIRFSAICRLNLMTVAAWLPLIIVIGICLTQILNTAIVSGDYQNYLQTGDLGSLTEEQAAALAGMDMDNLMGDIVLSAVSTFCLWAIPCILITGPVKAGLAYVTRNWARDEHAFPWSDFKDAVKQNWKQALGISAISSVIPLILNVGYSFYGGMAQDHIIFVVPQMLMVMLSAVWALGCVFMYPILVTYNVNFRTLVKNGLMLAIGRLPQTVGVRLAMLVPTALAVLIFMWTGSVLVLLIWAIYYVLVGYALTRFVFASYTNGVFDKYINNKIEGVQVNRGLAAEEDLDDEDEETEEKQ